MKSVRKNDDELTKGKNIKTIEVMEVKSGQGESMDVNEATVNRTANSEKDISTSHTEERSTVEKQSVECTRANKADVKGQSKHTEPQMVEKELSTGKEVIADEAKEPKRKELSEEEAAIKIQSQYRGFAIRRCEPLKKLKQIAKVREQIAEVNKLIQAMDLSTDIQGDNKQRPVIGETIMSLLLKLDTVQGLHPSIRDIRKSVARELISLQEKLDSLINENTETSLGHESTYIGDEGAVEETKDDAFNQGRQAVENTSAEGILCQNGNEACSDVVESCHDQLPGGSESENMEIPDKLLVEDQLGGHMGGHRENQSTELSESCAIQRIQAGQESVPETGDEQNCEEQENNKDSISKTLEDCGGSMYEQTSEISVPPTKSGQEMTNLPVKDGDMPVTELAELPYGVIDDDIDVQDCMQHKKFRTGKSDFTSSEVMVDVDGAKEGSKAESVTIELKDNLRDNENEEGSEQSEEMFSQRDDMEVQAEGEETSVVIEHVKICAEDDRSASVEVVEDKLGDSRAEYYECTSQPLRSTVTKINEKKAADDEIELEMAVKDELLDTIPESDKCLSELLHNIGSKINEPAEADDKIGAEGIVKNKLGDARAESDECPSQSPRNAGAIVSEPIEASDDWKLQKVEPCQGEYLEGQASQSSMENVNIAAHNCGSTAHDNGLSKGTALVPADVTESANRYTSPMSPTTSQEPHDSNELTESNKKMIEENERLREMMEKLINAGQEQLTALYSLSGRVKDLEKRLSRKKKLKTRRYKVPSAGLSCMNRSRDYMKEISVGVAM